jgi:general L-amino acid transport system substrate-binding protein
MRRALLLLAAIGCLCLGPGASAGTLDRIRAAKELRCGSAIRPGLAFPAVDHTWHGIEVDLCRAIAAAVLGEGGKIVFTGYVLPKDFSRIRTGADDLAFLTTTEIATNDLFGGVLPGPTVFHETTAAMVWKTSAVKHLADLDRHRVCVEPGTPSERNLLDYAASVGWQPTLSPWMEVEEMMDAFNVGRCTAVVGEGTALAALRLTSVREGHAAEILPEPLAVAPINAATALVDPPWSAVVAWSIDTLFWSGERGKRADAHSLSIPAAALGLEGDWQARLLAAAGSYDDMYRRSVGEDSVLDLPPGVNASWRAGGLRVAPDVQ